VILAGGQTSLSQAQLAGAAELTPADHPPPGAFGRRDSCIDGVELERTFCRRRDAGGRGAGLGNGDQLDERERGGHIYEHHLSATATAATTTAGKVKARIRDRALDHQLWRRLRNAVACALLNHTLRRAGRCCRGIARSPARSSRLPWR